MSEAEQQTQETDETHDDHVMTNTGADLQPAPRVGHQKKEMLKQNKKT